jgi:tetratricopeptide (TPR) repeat protein
MRGSAGIASLLLLLTAGFTLSCTIESRTPTSHGEATVETAASPSPRWSMQKWREAREEAGAAMLAPMGEKRINRCQAFLDKYPDYPEREVILRELVDAVIEKDKGRLDFARLDGLLQQIVGRRSEYYKPDFVLDWYYLKYGFPVEMTERVAAQVREALARDRKDLASESDPKRLREAQRRLTTKEFLASIAEGRILLAKGDYPGAIRKLLEAEEVDSRVGAATLTLVDSRGAVEGTLPIGSAVSDRLNLALATAYSRVGKREEALARLERVRGLLTEFFPDIARDLAALRKEVAVPAPDARVVRSDPKLSADFHFKDLQGREVALSDFRGRVVLTMFWSTW